MLLECAVSKNDGRQRIGQERDGGLNSRPRATPLPLDAEFAAPHRAAHHDAGVVGEPGAGHGSLASSRARSARTVAVVAACVSDGQRQHSRAAAR